MDFMSILPVELIEEILSYLTGDEIVNCGKVSKIWRKSVNEESLWRRLCIRKGFLSKSKEIFSDETKSNSWREYFWVMYNWRNMRYICYTVEDNGAIEQAQLCGTALLIPSKCRIRIWNVYDKPKLEQELDVITCKSDGFNLRTSNNYAVYDSGGIIQIFKKYSLYKFSLLKVLYFLHHKRLEDCSGSADDLVEEYSSIKKASHLKEEQINPFIFVELSDNTLVIFQGEILFVWYLNNWQRCTVVIPENIVVFAVRIQLPWLYLVTLVGVEYIIKIFDLNKNNWLMDLYLTTDDPRLMLQPRLIVGKLYFITAGVCVRDPMASSMIYVKVWKTEDGSLIATLNLPYCFFNCFIVDSIVILTTSTNVITIWDPVTNRKIRKLILYDNKYSQMKPLSNNLFLVSYKDYFEVWDWKTGVRLYETEKRYVCSYNQKVNSSFYVEPDADHSYMPYELAKPKRVTVFNFREKS